MTIRPSQPTSPTSSSPTVLDRSTVFQGAIFDVEDVSARLHDGRVTRRQVVAKADGAIVVPITKYGTLVMVRQPRHRHLVGSRASAPLRHRPVWSFDE